MEADWEVEIGGDAPVIDASWPGWIDLTQTPNRIDEIPEVHQLPALADALVRLNHSHLSSVWTSKCDFWQLEQFDPDELDATRESSHNALAGYIDLLPHSNLLWNSPAEVITFCKALCSRLHGVVLRSCRVDLIIRNAFFMPASDSLGITAYLTACGPNPEVAASNLSDALRAFADALTSNGEPPEGRSQLQ